jgi:hypothetical protein
VGVEERKSEEESEEGEKEKVRGMESSGKEIAMKLELRTKIRDRETGKLEEAVETVEGVVEVRAGGRVPPEFKVTSRRSGVVALPMTIKFQPSGWPDVPWVLLGERWREWRVVSD